MKRLCFGGSFNPIHHGHLICARAVAESAGYQRVVLFPTAQPPHKPVSEMAAAADRLAMCRLAVQSDSMFEVDDLELHRAGPSYSVDTVRELHRRGWPSVHWLIGADMVQLLPEWHEPEALMREARLVVMARPGWHMDFSQLPAPFRHLERNLVTVPLIQISATDIRRRVAAGLPVDYLVPEAVAQYMHQRSLYR